MNSMCTCMVKNKRTQKSRGPQRPGIRSDSKILRYAVTTWMLQGNSIVVWIKLYLNERNTGRRIKEVVIAPFASFHLILVATLKIVSLLYSGPYSHK